MRINECNEKAIIFGNKEIIPSVRTVKDMEEVILDKNWVKKNINQPLYYMYRDLSENEETSEKIKTANLRYDILDATPIFLGKEYNKTSGHYHSIVPGENLSYPELYEVKNGRVYYVLQKTDGDKIIDVYAIKAESGDKVLVPPDYGHVSIFLSEDARQSNWTSRKSISDYEPFKKTHGAAYYALRDENEKDGVKWIKNDNYGYVPPLRFSSPHNYKELGLSKKESAYHLVKNLKKLDFLNNPQNYGKLWEKALKG